MADKIAIYPGTFDPITLGHYDIIKRASYLFDRVIVAVAASSRKLPMFTLDQRITLARVTIEDLQNIDVIGFEGLLINCARQMGAEIIIRGLRAISDFEFEFQLAGMNRRMMPQMETLFMTPGEQYMFLSATMVREIAELGGDVSGFVHPEVKQALYKRCGRVDDGVNDN